MSGNDVKVQLDLNAPRFHFDLFSRDVAEVTKVFKTFNKLCALTWNEVFRDIGLYWEEVECVSRQYTIRLSQPYRAVVTSDTGWMRFAALRLDHDGRLRTPRDRGVRERVNFGRAQPFAQNAVRGITFTR